MTTVDTVKQDCSTVPASDQPITNRDDDSDIDDKKGAWHLDNVVIKQEKDLSDEFDDEMDLTSTKQSGTIRKNRTPLEFVLKKNLELMTSNVKSKSRVSYLNIICKNLNKPGIEPASTEEETAIKTEGLTVGDEDFGDEAKPVKKKRGRKAKSDAEKAATKKPRKNSKSKKSTPTKVKKGLKKEMNREATSGVEDQSGIDDTDFDPKDFETSAGEDNGQSDADPDAFFDQTIEYNCRFCNEPFKSNNKLLRHYKAAHSQTLETSSLCPYCGYTTGSKAMLNRHIRRKHMHMTKEKVKQVCEICSAEVYHLAVHKRSLHSGLSFPCSYCGKIFPRKGELQFHIKGIHLKHQLEKTYICEYCHKEFTFYNYLRRHMRVHTNEKPYKCADCGVGFNHNVSLKNHRTKCAKREMNLNTNSNASNSTAASTARSVAPGPPRGPAAPPPASLSNSSATIIAEVPTAAMTAQETINATLARLAGRFETPVYYY